MCSAKCGRKTARYLTNPKKPQTLVTKFGVSHCNIFLHLDNCGSMPHADMWWLRKSSSVKKNWDFFGFMYKCAHCRACKTKSMCSLNYLTVKCGKIAEVTLGTPDVKSRPMRYRKGLWLQLMCCTPFRLLSQDFGTRLTEYRRSEYQSKGQSCSQSRI